MMCGASLLLFYKKCVLCFFFSYLRKITILNVSENSLDELLRNQTASQTHINKRNDPIIFFFFFIFTLAFPAQISSLVHVLKTSQLLQFLRFQGLYCFLSVYSIIFLLWSFYICLYFSCHFPFGCVWLFFFFFLLLFFFFGFGSS